MIRKTKRTRTAKAVRGKVSALRRQLSWSHFKQLIYIPDKLKRDFYAEMCRVEGWSTRVLAKKVGGMLYERTALSKKPEEIIRQELTVLREKGDVSPTLVFQDPYMLDFLQLADTYSEKDLESAILREIERFVLELGSGFAFIERQKRITLDGDDYYIDLLFFHRRMRRLVAVELKIGDFKTRDTSRAPTASDRCRTAPACAGTQPGLRSFVAGFTCEIAARTGKSQRVTAAAPQSFPLPRPPSDAEHQPASRSHKN